VRTLLRYFSARYLRRHPFRVFLSVMSVALGVALFASIDVSNTSTEAAFRRTVTALAGNAQLQVVKSRSFGVGEEALKKIDAVAGVVAAPVLQLSVTMPGVPDSLLILGLDFKREGSFRLWDVAEGEKPQINPLAFFGGDLILISRTFAAKHQLKLGGGFIIRFRFVNAPDDPELIGPIDLPSLNIPRITSHVGHSLGFCQVCFTLEQNVLHLLSFGDIAHDGNHHVASVICDHACADFHGEDRSVFALIGSFESQAVVFTDEFDAFTPDIHVWNVFGNLNHI